MGNRGELEINPAGANIEVNESPSFDFAKKKINEVQYGETNVGILGTIVQVFEPRFYEACPQCGKKLEHLGDSYSCKSHGLVVQEYVPILNVLLDDGTDSLRAVAFRNQAERLLHLTKEALLEIRTEPVKFETYREELLGKQLLLVGRIVKNEMFDRKEMMIQRVIEITPEELIKELEESA